MSTPDELPVQRFYLRKIEGADVLLADETNFLRQELHKWAPVAPEPPRMIDMSLSTRKPRPTKQQKLMAQLGITNPDDLPEHLRPKQPGIKKKEKDEKKQSTSKAPSSKGGNVPDSSHTPPGLPHGLPPYESESRPSTALPTDGDRQSTFSYDAMSGGVSFAQQDSPMFAPSHHPMTHGSSASPRVQTSSHLISGIDPQLESMFGRPSSSGNRVAERDPLDRPDIFPTDEDNDEHQNDNDDPLNVFRGFFGEEEEGYPPL
jgi:histone demethylase JARID1